MSPKTPQPDPCAGEALWAEFEVSLRLLPRLAEAGRQTSVISGYRPNHLDLSSGTTFIGIVDLPAPVAPGASSPAHIRVLALPAQLAAVQAAGGWPVYEGPRHVGEVRIVRCTRAPSATRPPKPWPTLRATR